jgi:N-acetylglucosaminyl-diphospho-decaprenol L-rhamnosyltransferase
MHLFISVVSHAQQAMAERCLNQLMDGIQPFVDSGLLTVSALLTHNLPEPRIATKEPRWQEHRNPTPLGFAMNHNAACTHALASSADWLLIANPDLDWATRTDFAALITVLKEASADIGAISLAQILPSGEKVEFARRLITPWQLAQRVWAYAMNRRCMHPSVAQADWLNAACLIVRKDAFLSLDGFDTRYRLYCEDVDFSLRLRLAAWKLAVADVRVIHDTRRDSATHWRYRLWHMRSLWRLWTGQAFWRYVGKQKLRKLLPPLTLIASADTARRPDIR